MHTNRTTPAHYNYTLARRADGITVSYKQARYSPMILLPLMVIFALPAGFFTLSARMNFTGWVVLTLILSAIVYGVLNVFRRQRSFAITQTAFTVNGQSYDRKHIHQVFIKRPGQQEQRNRYESNTVMIASGIPGAMAMGAATLASGTRAILSSAGDGVKAQIVKKNYQIGFLYGERRIRLATGLAESTAQAMYREIFNPL